jgi:CRISPR-associated protein Cmr5
MQQTRAQKDLALAYELVSDVQKQHPEAKNETKSIYAQLCKQFPVMVLQSGLCQTLAFHADKAKKEDTRGQAHRYILQHVAKIMNVTNALEEAQKVNAMTYIHHTRRILEAWVFFKRFAVSALTIEKEVN